MVRPFRSRAWTACACVLFAAWTGACARDAADTSDETPAEVPTITADQARVERGTIASTLIVRGSIVALPNEDVRVSALVPGRIDTLTVAEGDTVQAGQVLARLDTRMLRDQQRQADAVRAQAVAQVENARLNLQRNEQLFARGVAAGKEVEDARLALAQASAALEQATAALSTAAAQLERADVRSPIAGQVVTRMVSVGEQVDGTASQPVVEIANLDRVELAANVPADQLASMGVGRAVTVSTTTWPTRTFSGRIVAIAPAVDATTNTTTVRIRIDNPELLLRLGMFAEAQVTLVEHAQALLVPASALVRQDGEAAVYVVNGDTAVRTAVTTGLEANGQVELVSGVTERTFVLTSGVHGLGDSVKLARPQ